MKRFILGVLLGMLLAMAEPYIIEPGLEAARWETPERQQLRELEEQWELKGQDLTNYLLRRILANIH